MLDNKKLNRSSNDRRALGLKNTWQIYVNTTNAVNLNVIWLENASRQSTIHDCDATCGYRNCCSDDSARRQIVDRRRVDGGPAIRAIVLVVATGIRNNRLLFVAITGDPKDSPTTTTSIVTGGSTTDHNWHILKYPDGTEQRLPKPNVQLFQYIDGNWSESPGDVTPLEYDEFCASKPKHFTIQSLLAFVENRRRNAR